ncbi:hypothetical protein J2Y73_005104 [Peribacillus frigoritolerans]|uniref:hypothetical protein n=2 Tax=Peribacillus frigoritolerans TaxID=450367 RepID=UPI000BBA1D80|nr:hypothetical protein [Peribacillus frigoritolerans]MCP1495073.1 hypothetical protein [Peribacillus frigoritolerans]PCD06996.1 hypothetical protein CMV16_15495 [Peribacillus simplex]
MKLDNKKKKVQMKYREEIREKKELGNHSKKMLVIVTTIIKTTSLVEEIVLPLFFMHPLGFGQLPEQMERIRNPLLFSS